MLEKVTLADFQAHETFTLEFDPQVTTIIGPNDVGKSTVLRALYFLCLNEQTRWDKIVRWGEEECKVLLHVDGHKIIRRRGKSVNSYTLDGKKFVSFGAKVPDPVAAVLNVSWDNFQRQLDSHFWFGDSGGEVSKRLNEIVDLGQIDRSLSFLSGEGRRATAAVELSTERVTALEESVASLSWVEDFSKEYQKVRRLSDRFANYRDKTTSLAAILEEAVSLSGVVDRAAAVALDGKDTVQLGTCFAEAVAKRETLEALLGGIRREAKVAKVPVPDDLDALLAVRKQGDAVAERRRSLEYLLEELVMVKETATKAESDLTQFVTQTGVCPTCLRPISRKSEKDSDAVMVLGDSSPKSGKQKIVGSGQGP